MPRHGNGQVTIGTRRRRGLSLLEVVVVIGLIALLLALLLPSVQQSRQSALGIHCVNNLKQIGLALQSYHDSHSCFPPGITPGPVGEDNVWPQFYASYGWGAQLLPYLGQTALYDQLDIRTRSLEDRLLEPDAPALVQTRLSVYRCPVDLAGDTTEDLPMIGHFKALNRGAEKSSTPGLGDIEGTEPIYAGTSSYVASCGYYEVFQPLSPVPGTFVDSKDRVTAPNNGVFYPGSHVRFADITYGASQTLSIGERAWYQGGGQWVGTANIRGSWSGGAGVCLGRVFWRINEIPDPPGLIITPDSDEKLRSGSTARDGFSSYHSAGANFLFADGSVRFLSEMIESRSTTDESADVSDPVPDRELLGLYQRLGIRNDGLPTAGY